jgi:hypothetical protein
MLSTISTNIAGALSTREKRRAKIRRLQPLD